MLNYIKFHIITLLIIKSLTVHAQDNNVYIYHRDYSDTDYIEFHKSYLNDSIYIYSEFEKHSELYLSNAYLSAGYDSIIVRDSVYYAWFTRGPVYYWGYFNIDCAENEVGKILLKNQLSGKKVNILELETLQKKILDYYQNTGYPFAIIEPEEISINDSTVQAGFFIDKGPEILFDSIIVKGDVNISEFYLRNYLSLLKATPFSMQKIRQTVPLIRSLAFLEMSADYELAFSQDRADLLLYLKKKKANQFNGMIGILPNNQTSGKLLITGDLNLALLNAFGAGENLILKWKKYDTESQTMNFGFFYPYLLKSRFGTGLSFMMEKQDSSYLSTDLLVNLRYFTFADNGFDVFYQAFNSFLLNNNNPNQDFANIKTNLGGISFKYSKADNIFNPKRARIFYISSALGTRISNLSSESEEKIGGLQSRSTMYAAIFIPIFQDISIKIANRSSFMYSEKLFINELYRIGGLNTIRGFDEISLPASSFSVSNLELRYIFEENSAFFGFYDFAYFERRFTKDDNYFLAHGTGAGIDLQTNAGVFSIVYALGSLTNSPLDINNSKIHIGYRNSF
jgi:outer membrane protein assembly factor BamA